MLEKRIFRTVKGLSLLQLFSDGAIPVTFRPFGAGRHVDVAGEAVAVVIYLSIHERFTTN